MTAQTARVTLSMADIRRIAAEVARIMAEAAPQEEPMRLSEAAAYIRRPESYIYKHITDIPHEKRGGRLYFFRSCLTRWIKGSN